MKTHKYLIDVLTIRQKMEINVIIMIWFLTILWFWGWWLRPDHVVSTIGMFLISIFLAWNTLLPAYFIFFLLRMKKPNPLVTIPNIRVAMIVTRAPSEPFELLKKTLEAMIAQKYPHDNWLADEDPTPDVYAWCKENNILISTRKGVVEYNNPVWPRRAKSKEGNLAYFYDKYGYSTYDVVVQLDADHIPQENYLEEMIRPFSDPKVGYVSSPSICSNNSSKSWSARARLWSEAGLHGPQQLGHNDSFAPLCFGSHYAVRTKALQEVGGLGPELAEDHSTTLMMNVFGWKGVHAVDAIALGDGPATFADAMIQEFQWSKSLIIILLTITPSYIKKLSTKLKIQFLFSEIWYPLFSTITFISFLIPIFALVLNNPFVRVSFLDFTLRYLVLMLVMIILVSSLRRFGLLVPKDSRMFSWETFLFQIMRWPWVLFGCISGLYTSITKGVFNFRVTPKGPSTYEPIPFQIMLPYLVIILLNIIILYIPINPYMSSGNYFFVWMNALTFLLASVLVLFLHFKENK